jgi:hypothetical protein
LTQDKYLPYVLAVAVAQILNAIFLKLVANGTGTGRITAKDAVGRYVDML